jgi:hypothetical protein
MKSFCHPDFFRAASKSSIGNSITIENESFQRLSPDQNKFLPPGSLRLEKSRPAGPLES